MKDKLGIDHSKLEWRKKLSDSHKGIHPSAKTKAMMSEIAKKGGFGKWNKGRNLSEEHKKDIGESLKKAYQEGRKKREKGFEKGHKVSKERREKYRELFKKRIGKLNPNWKGGKPHNFYNQRRRAKKYQNGGSHTLADWENLKAQYNWNCPCCHKPEPEIKLTEDHIIPLSKGGSDNIENIQPLCKQCNFRKHTKIIKYG